MHDFSIQRQRNKIYENAVNVGATPGNSSAAEAPNKRMEVRYKRDADYALASLNPTPAYSFGNE